MQQAIIYNLLHNLFLHGKRIGLCCAQKRAQTGLVIKLAPLLEEGRGLLGACEMFGTIAEIGASLDFSVVSPSMATMCGAGVRGTGRGIGIV